MNVYTEVKEHCHSYESILIAFKMQLMIPWVLVRSRRSPPFNAVPNAMLEGHRLPIHQQESIGQIEDLSFGGEVGLELRGLASLTALAVAGVGGSLAASSSRACGSVILLLGTAASAFTGGTLVCERCRQ